MASSEFGRKRYTYSSLREPLGVKGVRQSVVITNNPSSIDQNQQLLFRFPNHGKDDVIVPGTARLAFTIALDNEDANRTVVQNLGRAIVKKLTIKISGNKSAPSAALMSSTVTMISGRQTQRGQMVIIWGSMPLITETRRGFESVPETMVQTRADALEIASSSHSTSSCSRATCHLTRAHCGRLEYELTFNDYSRVIQATGDVDSSYHIGGISLEYDMVTLPELARTIDNQYKGRLAILYDRVLRHRKMTADKSDTLWNINLNVPPAA